LPDEFNVKKAGHGPAFFVPAFCNDDFLCVKSAVGASTGV